ncbi:MAG: hypothetical protein M1839_006697 [Geoglossum umbratile]|nr:MAG: hypothetical protein M1839_006697 [Geoglossum umbratile]
MFNPGLQYPIVKILNTLLTDLNQESASTAQAACNIVRCLLAAAAMSCIQIIIDHVGVGFCFTIIAAITALCLPLLAVERAKGLGWRQSRERGRANIIAPAEEESRAGSPKEGNPTVD